MLRAEPRRWEPVDSLLVVAEMFWTLQSSSFEAGFDRALLRERAGDAAFEWLDPRGGRWDAALDGSASPEPVTSMNTPITSLALPVGSAVAMKGRSNHVQEPSVGNV